MKRNSRSLDLPATSSLRRSLHQRSNSDGKNDTAFVESPTNTTPSSSTNSNQQNNGSSLLSTVLPNSPTGVFKKLGSPTRKQSVRSQVWMNFIYYVDE